MLEDAQPICYAPQHMNTHKRSSNSQVSGEQGATKAQNQPHTSSSSMALDVPAASIVVVRMLDEAKPPPPQTFKPDAFLAWVQKQRALAQEIVRLRNGNSTVRASPGRSRR